MRQDADKGQTLYMVWVVAVALAAAAVATALGFATMRAIGAGIDPMLVLVGLAGGASVFAGVVTFLWLRGPRRDPEPLSPRTLRSGTSLERGGREPARKRFSELERVRPTTRPAAVAPDVTPLRPEEDPPDAPEERRNEA